MSESATGAALDDDARLAAALVRDAAGLAAAMGDEARGAGSAGLGTERKTSVSDLVTRADHAAERLVLDRLAADRPDDAVVGEEGAARAGRSGRTWVVDPVDGTYNFVHGLPWWCSAVALVLGDPAAAGPAEVLLGAVHDPASGTTYVGGPGLATTAGGRPLEALPDVPLAATCAATYLHPPFLAPGEEAVAAAFARLASGTATVRMLGSASMDATAVARGQLGLSAQHTVADWDRLPGWGLVLGAGGAARRLEAAGRTWTLSGAPTAVAEAADRLADR